MPLYFEIPIAVLDQVRTAEDARDDAREILDFALASADGLHTIEMLRVYRDRLGEASEGGMTSAVGEIGMLQERFHGADREFDDRLAGLVEPHRQDKDLLGARIVEVEVNYQTRCLTLTLSSDAVEDDDE